MIDLEKAKADFLASHNAQVPPEPKGPGGPKTEAGKQRTRLNAYKHGLTGQIHIFSAEERKAFDAHCAGIVEALAPVGPLEIDLAQAIAENRWRLKSVRTIESRIIAASQIDQKFLRSDDPAQLELDEAIDQAHAWVANADNLKLVALYEQRINRTVERNMAELRTLRAERQVARDQAIEEALLLAELAKSKGETYDPAADRPSQEFVFSSGEFERLFHRRQRLDEARALPKTRINPNSGRQMPAAA